MFWNQKTCFHCFWSTFRKSTIRWVAPCRTQPWSLRVILNSETLKDGNQLRKAPATRAYRGWESLALCQGKVHQREDSIGLWCWGNELLHTRTMKWEQRKVTQGTSIKQPYPAFFCFKTYQWFHSGTEFGSSLSLSRAPSPPVTADVFSLASHGSLTPQHWDLGLPQPVMWFHGSGHGVGSYPCLDHLSCLSSIPCLCLLPLPLPKHMSSSHKLLHIPQDPLKDSLFSKTFTLFPKLIRLCSQDCMSVS